MLRCSLNARGRPCLVTNGLPIRAMLRAQLPQVDGLGEPLCFLLPASQLLPLATHADCGWECTSATR